MAIFRYFWQYFLIGVLSGGCFSSLFATSPDNHKPGQPPPRLSGEVFRISTQTVGSPFFFDNWSPGTVVLTTGAEIDDHLLMYNGFTDELIYQHPSTFEIIIADKDQVRGFVLKNNGRRDFFRNFSGTNWSGFPRTGTYYRVLHEGNISLVVLQRVKKAGEVAEYSADGPQIRTKLIPDPSYFILLNDGRSFLIRKFNRRTLFVIFPENREEVRKALRSSSIKHQTDNERTELIRNLEELIFIEN